MKNAFKNFFKKIMNTPREHKVIGVLACSTLVLGVGFGVVAGENFALIEQRNLILETVERNELGQLKADAAWFQQGCESTVDAVIAGGRDESEQVSLEINLWPLKQACATTAEAVYEELLKRRDAEKNEPADFEEDSE